MCLEPALLKQSKMQIIKNVEKMNHASARSNYGRIGEKDNADLGKICRAKQARPPQVPAVLSVDIRCHEIWS